MQRTQIRRSVLGFAACIFSLALASSAAAEVPGKLTHQGRLLDDEGAPVTDSVQMTFTLYDSPSGDDAILWQTQQEVTPDETGFYTVTLGSSDSPIDASILEGGEAWLEVQVEGTALEPRYALNSSPYAVVADQADSVREGAVTEESLADDFSLPKDRVGGLDEGTLGGLSCEAGKYAKYDGSMWTCATPDTETKWSDIKNRPNGLDDGDADALGQLSCMSGQLARWNGRSWECATNEPNWSDVQNVPAELADGDDDTLGGLSCSSGEIATYDGANWTCTPNATEWSDVQNVPNDLTDGDDDTLAAMSCADGEQPVWNNSSSTWECGDPYTDSDAVSAMGSKGDGNALRHDRYTDREARKAVGRRTYTVWGQTSCAASHRKLYTGHVASFTSRESTGDTVCLDKNAAPSNGWSDWGDAIIVRSVARGDRVQHTNETVECAVCEGGTMVRWGASRCPSGWNKAYDGHMGNLLTSWKGDWTGGGGFCLSSNVSANWNDWNKSLVVRAVGRDQGGDRVQYQNNNSIQCAVCY